MRLIACAFALSLLHSSVSGDETHHGQKAEAKQVFDLVVGTCSNWCGNIMYGSGITHARSMKLSVVNDDANLLIAKFTFEGFGHLPKIHEDIDKPAIDTNRLIVSDYSRANALFTFSELWLRNCRVTKSENGSEVSADVIYIPASHKAQYDDDDKLLVDESGAHSLKAVVRISDTQLSGEVSGKPLTDPIRFGFSRNE